VIKRRFSIVNRRSIRKTSEFTQKRTARKESQRKQKAKLR
jgi:hypothetical protein